jgi:hypothetical protein
LVKKIDETNASNGGMASCVVFCSDEEGLDKKLKELAGKEKLKKTILTIDNPAGPGEYRIAKDAEVTVLVYRDKTVSANLAFKKGELKAADADKVLAELGKILPKK